MSFSLLLRVGAGNVFTPWKVDRRLNDAVAKLSYSRYAAVVCHVHRINVGVETQWVEGEQGKQARSCAPAPSHIDYSVYALS